jgi:Uma2 family endonuclease
MEIALDLSKRYSYADYLGWLDDIRRELIDGVVRVMAAPRWEHQDVNACLIGELRRIVHRHRGNCRVYPAPFDVRLPVNGETADGDIYTTVQPDVCVLCDLSKLSGSGCVGTPDLVIEVQSPSTGQYDLDTKLHLYERHGVREYWVVDPLNCCIHVFTPGVNGLYGTGVLYSSGFIPVSIFGGELISLSDIFEYYGVVAVPAGERPL